MKDIVTSLIQEESQKMMVVIQFNSEKTPGELYEKTINTLEEAMATVIALSDQKMLEMLRHKLSDMSAQVYNAEARLHIKGPELRIQEKAS